MPALRDPGMIPDATPTRWADDERDEVRAAIARVVDDGPWIGGPVVDAFEEAFATYTELPHLVGCASGTDALVLAMTGLDLPVGSGILVAGNDGGYAAVAARLAGLEPVAYDLDPVTLAPTAATIAAADHPGVTAVTVTHLHGDPLPLDEVDAWRRRRGIALIEDAAQAHGARSNGRHVGAHGDATAFSFYPTKNLGAIGDAGAVAFLDGDAAARARRLAQYGWSDKYRAELPRGRNSRLDALQAAVLLARLPFLDARNQRRREVHARYAAESSQRLLEQHEGSVAHHAVVVTDRRDELTRHLTARGVGSAIHYPIAVVRMPGLALDRSSTPVAVANAEHVLSVPCTPELTTDEVDRVVEALASWGDT